MLISHLGWDYWGQYLHRICIPFSDRNDIETTIDHLHIVWWLVIPEVCNFGISKSILTVPKGGQNFQIRHCNQGKQTHFRLTMVNKNCMYGVCKSDSRYPERLAEKDVHFIPFPKPLRNRVKCERWIRACGRPDLNVEKVTKYSYICSLHFVRGNGPTEEYPDPIPAGACEAEKENFMLQNRKRRAPIDRPSLVCRKVKKPGTKCIYNVIQCLYFRYKGSLCLNITLFKIWHDWHISQWHFLLEHAGAAFIHVYELMILKNIVWNYVGAIQKQFHISYIELFKLQTYKNINL